MNKFIFYYISFRVTLYPAYSWLGRGNLVLRHSVLHFPPNFKDIARWVAELNTVTRRAYHLHHWATTALLYNFTMEVMILSFTLIIFIYCDIFYILEKNVENSIWYLKFLNLGKKLKIWEMTSLPCGVFLKITMMVTKIIK